MKSLKDMTCRRLRGFLPLCLLACLPLQLAAADKVVLTRNADGTMVLSNGLVSMTLNNEGTVTAMNARGHDVIRQKPKSEVGYVGLVTNKPSKDYPNPQVSMNVVTETDDMVEVQYVHTERPIHMTNGYVMKRGVSGVYNYLMLKCYSLEDNGIHEARMGWRVNSNELTYAWVSDQVQGEMPAPAALRKDNILKVMQDATFMLQDSTVYTKYDWANYMQDDLMHGIMGKDYGAWIIVPSYEWVGGGVCKQDLMVHQTDKSPILLAHYHSNHFGSKTINMSVGQQKLYGPYLLYINNGTRDEMVADAKKTAIAERQAWPYQWFKNEQYPMKRGTVTGTIKLSPVFKTTKMQVVLAKPGVKPQLQGDGYMFWTETDKNGNFTIENVRPGQYAVYAWALGGQATGMMESNPVTIKPGQNKVGTIEWKPERYEQLLWMIGEADKRTTGFKWSDHKRQYGLSMQTPSELTYTIGQSKTSDWYYAQGVEGTWTIRFHLDKKPQGALHLTIATAGSAGNAKVNVKYNGKKVFDFKALDDGSVYRSAMLSGCDSTYVVDIPEELVKKGENTITFSLWNVGKRGLGGVLYDCIKLEVGRKGEQPKVSVARYEGDRQAAISYTFDDGLKDQYTVLFPKLKEFGIKATFSIIGSSVGGKWKKDSCMTWEMIRELAADGQEITSHGWQHKDPNKIFDEALRYEVQHNDTVIYEQTGQFPRTFVYPWNRKPPHAVAFVSKDRVGSRMRQSGFGGSRDSVWFEKWTDRLLREGDWGIPLIHGIVTGYDHYDNPQRLWNHFALMNSLRDKVWIATFHDVCAYVTERDTITLETKQKGNTLTVTPKMPLDKRIYHQPLTLVIEGCQPKQVRQQRQTLTLIRHDDRTLVNFDPHGGEIEIKL